MSTPALTDEVAVPTNINQGLACPTPDFLTSLLGVPRAQMTQTCQPVTNQTLAALIQTTNIGPFAITGLRPAVSDLKQVMDEIKLNQPDIYAKLGTAGMLCCRLQRNSATRISSHSWGTAIDLKLDGKLDVRGNGKVYYGLTLIAPIFNRHGWFWGATFRTEDAMHFEVSKSKLQQWQAAGLLGAVRAGTVPGTTPGAGTVLKRGDKGPAVRLLQEKLNQHGARLKVDGDFGSGTEQEVRNFQRKRGLMPDGIVGPNTRKALGM